MRIGIGLSIGRFRPSVLTAALIFRAPLQTNILTTRGPGTTTYTHASTATVVEFEGVERTVKSGEARMQEWRRVENLYANSTTLVTQSNTVVAGVYLVQFRGTGSVTLSGAGTGTITGTGANNLAWALVTTTAGTLTSTVSGSCTSGQLENVTGQSIQTPAEYVPTGTGGPNFGVELNTTGANGWAPSAANISVSGSSLTVVGTNAAYGYAFKGFTTVVGKTYKFNAGVSGLSGGGPAFIFVGTAAGTNSNANITVTSATQQSFTFQATSTTTVVSVYAFGGLIGNAATYDNISIAECLFSGAAVDGVKYFETKLDGSSIPKTATSGYLNEPQRTNLLLSACDLTGAAWVNGSTTVSTGSVYSVFTSQMIASTGATWNRKSQTVSLTTTTYAVSAYYKIGSSGKAYVALYLDATHYIDADFNSVGTRLSGGSLGITVVSAWKSTLVPGSTNLFVADCVVTITSAGSYGIGLGPDSTTVGQTVEFLGAQVEAGSSISSVIPTTTASAVRAADSLAMPVSVAVGPTNLALWSQDFTNNAISAGVTPTTTSIAFASGSGSRILKAGTFGVGPYTVAFKCSPADAGKQFYLGVWDSVLDGLTTGRSTIKTVPADGGIIVFNVTSSGGAGYAGVIGDTTAYTLNNPAIGLFPGTLTAAQILSAGGIPLTTTAPNANSQGTMVVTLSASGADAAGRYPGVSLRSVSGTDAMDLYVDSTLGMGLRIRSNGSIVLNQYVGSLLANTAYRIAVSWNNGRIAYSVNGGAVTVLTGITMPLALALFKAVADTEWFGTITTPTVYSQALSDATLRAITA